MRSSRLWIFSIVAVLLGILPASSSNAEPTKIQYLKLKYTTITNPVIQTTTGAQSVIFNAFFETDGYAIVDGDLRCSDNASEIASVVTKLNQNEYSASCTFKYTDSSTSGLRPIYMSTRYEMADRPRLLVIPANAKMIYPVKEKDSFGLEQVRNIYAYELFARQAILISAPVAINPPAAFKYPNFPEFMGSHTIFDVRNSLPNEFNLTINRKAKSFSGSCKDQIPLALTDEAKIHRKSLLWGTWGSLTLEAGKKATSHSYLSGYFRGKELKFLCSYFVGLKNPIFGGVQVSYVESVTRTVRFPNK